MKMNVLSIAIVAVFAISSCNSTESTKRNTTEDGEVAFVEPAAQQEAEDGNVEYTIAKNYFVKNIYKNSKVETLKITTQEQFDKIFGMAATMGEDGIPTKIDFSKRYVIAIVGPVTNKDEDFGINGFVKKGNELILKYTFDGEKEQSFTTQPCLVIILDNKYTGEIKFEKK